MGRNIVEKIVDAHRSGAALAAPDEIALDADQVLIHDNSGPLALMHFEAMNADRVHHLTAVCYTDHQTLQTGTENADVHRYLRSQSARLGLVFSRAGNGICHLVHLERFARPAGVLIGADSHTPTAGAIGMLALGTGGVEAAAAMAGAAYVLARPSVVRVSLQGTLAPFVCAKDIALRLMAEASDRKYAHTIFEYAGPSLSALSVADRASIANMGAEIGVVGSVFPSDENTHRFLKAQGREKDWFALDADPDAEYADELTLDLDSLEPLVLLPPGQGGVRPVKQVAGLAVDQVAIGTCGSASYEDLCAVAGMLDGRRVAPRVSLGIAPGSRQVLMTLAENGVLNRLLRAGSRVLEPACGFCVGSGFVPPSDSVALRTSNRNSWGRSGNRTAKVYLASPQTAAATALTGKITDPRDLGTRPTVVAFPERFCIDDSLLERPPEDPTGIDVITGPGINKPPAAEPLPDRLRASVGIKLADAVSADDIIPGGIRNRHRADIPEYARYLFEHLDPDFYRRAWDIKKEGGTTVIVAGENYGYGSAREHAALCALHVGVKAVIAKSIAPLQRANLINFGLLPLEFTLVEDYQRLDREDILVFEDLRRATAEREEIRARNISKGTDLLLRLELNRRQRGYLLVGGMVNYMSGRCDG